MKRVYIDMGVCDDDKSLEGKIREGKDHEYRSLQIATQLHKGVFHSTDPIVSFKDDFPVNSLSSLQAILRNNPEY